jgi:hypothetical protein
LRLETLAGHAARGPWSVSKSVVPFESFVAARFWRRRACGDATISRGGDPILGERDTSFVNRGLVFFLGIRDRSLLSSTPRQRHYLALDGEKRGQGGDVRGRQVELGHVRVRLLRCGIAQPADQISLGVLGTDP